MTDETMHATHSGSKPSIAQRTLPARRNGRGIVTGCDLSDVDCLRFRFRQDPFLRMRPPLCHQAMKLSLELAATAYHLEFASWVDAGWTDISIQIDDTLQSGVTNGDQMHTFINNWKISRAKSALREWNPFSQIMGALRQREKSDTIKAFVMLRKSEDEKYMVAIGFMGTGKRFYDWFSNLRFNMENGFHKGFAQLVEYFQQQAEHILFPNTAAELGLERLTLRDILTEMQSARSRFFLWMAGHSQGAAVMQIFTHKLITGQGVLPENMVGYGFASPTVATGQSVYDPAGYPLYHIVNSDDMVPRVGALMHLGLCLHYQADEAFHGDCYALSADPSVVSARRALQGFTTQMTDTLSVMEMSVAFCYCLLEEKGEESLSSLMEKKWTIAPIEKALAYAGDKVQEAMKAIVRYMQNGYLSLAGRPMNPMHVAKEKEALRPIVRQYTLRQLFAALGDLSIAPHMIMRGDFKLPGAYSYIVLHGYVQMKPYIWVKRKMVLPQKHFGTSVCWHDLGSFDADEYKAPHLRRTRRKSHGIPNIRTKALTVQKGLRKGRRSSL